MVLNANFHESVNSPANTADCTQGASTTHKQPQRKEVWRISRLFPKVHPVSPSLCASTVHSRQTMRNQHDSWCQQSRTAPFCFVCVNVWVRVHVEGTCREEVQGVRMPQEMVENSLSRTSWLSVFRDTFFLTFRLIERTWKHTHTHAQGLLPAKLKRLPLTTFSPHLAQHSFWHQVVCVCRYIYI